MGVRFASGDDLLSFYWRCWHGPEYSLTILSAGEWKKGACAIVLEGGYHAGIERSAKPVREGLGSCPADGGGGNHREESEALTLAALKTG